MGKDPFEDTFQHGPEEHWSNPPSDNGAMFSKHRDAIPKDLGEQEWRDSGREPEKAEMFKDRKTYKN